MQERPICFQCDRKIETNAEMVFEAPCGHDDCASAVFHALCLFEWRERRAEIEGWLKRKREEWLAEHGEREKQEEQA